MIPFFCALTTIASVYYVFFFLGEASVEQETTRLDCLRERKAAVYENLRDLNFEYSAGKLPDLDYHSLRDSLEGEAAALLSEITRLEGTTTRPPRVRKKGARG
jgi:CDP-glycerol glycerophosphotransferase (TagB/SpsB family)